MIEKKKELSVFESFKMMNAQMFAKYVPNFIDDVNKKGDNMLDRLNASIGVKATEAFYKLIASAYEDEQDNDSNHQHE